MQLDELRNDILTDTEFRTLQRENPKVLFHVLEETHQHFFFGVEDHRQAESSWGGTMRVLINRNISLHLVPGFNDQMLSEEELPQFSVMPNEYRRDEVVETSTEVEGETIKGAIFYVDPLEFDALQGDAIRIAKSYPTWDAIPDVYFLDTELVRFVRRVILEDELVSHEREFDFRLGFVGDAAPVPDELAEPSAEELIQAYKERDGEVLAGC